MTPETLPNQPVPTPQIHGSVQTYPWLYQGQTCSIVSETLGTGNPILLLPAFSTVSSRQEMAGIAHLLATQFQTVTVDWLGFGDSARPNLPYGRSLYTQLLQDFVRDRFDQPVAVIAAGHAAGYAMHLAHALPSVCSKLLLVAPTWKGPLRAMGAPESLATGIRNLVRSHLLGPFLYTLNTQPGFLKWMYQRHVYVEVDKLTPDFMAQKYQITQGPGARFAPAAFVTGGLDPMCDRNEWIHVGQALTQPTLVILAENAPPQSKTEMEALARLAHIQSYSRTGSLGLHEEYGQEVGKIALEFCQT